jgi:S-adenosylmethionine hydrolase
MVFPVGRPIVFISDFGLDDEFVGICHGVIARISPEARVIDLTHGIPPQDIVRAALVLSEALSYVPEDAVLLAVVDPGVGTARRPVAVETRAGQVLVGPDNGVLSLAAEALGGAARAVEIASGSVVLPSKTETFHGRDVFAPAAAHVSAGMPLEELGPAVDPSSLATVQAPGPQAVEGRLEAVVLGIDRFGNVELNARPEHLKTVRLDAAESLQVRTVWRAVRVRRVGTFGEVDEGALALLVDSRGWLAVVQNGGSAAKALRLETGNPVILEPAG